MLGWYTVVPSHRFKFCTSLLYDSKGNPGEMMFHHFMPDMSRLRCGRDDDFMFPRVSRDRT